jgi:hypothetical protein
MEPPFIVSTGHGYELCWRYGKMGFYFIPSHTVRDGRLLFSLQATTSSGSRPGTYGSMPISSADEVHALATGGAFWVEPDDQEEKLEVRNAGTCGVQPVVAADAILLTSLLSRRG